MPSRLVWVISATLALCHALSAAALETVTDGYPERPLFTLAVRRDFLAYDFAKVEKIAQDARAGARFTDGCWRLPAFYSAFTIPPSSPEATWEAWLKRFDAWDKAAPDSVTARLARAEAWTARAGSPYQDGTPTPPARFTESVAEVRHILESTPNAKICPAYFQIMMWVARAQNWPEAEIEKLFTDAVALAPDYEMFYFRKAAGLFMSVNEAGNELRPAWIAFAEKAPTLTSRSLGVGMYTRIVWSMLDKSIAAPALIAAKMNRRTSDEAAVRSEKDPASLSRQAAAQREQERQTAQAGPLKRVGVDWQKMKQGFEDLAKLYPISLWNKNAFCFYAFCANDRETTARLLVELGDHFAPGIWPSEEYFRQVKTWAETGRVP